MVKRRHKPISDSEIDTFAHHKASLKGGAKTALTVDRLMRGFVSQDGAAECDGGS
jgi:hypothetical protein